VLKTYGGIAPLIDYIRTEQLSTHRGHNRNCYKPLDSFPQFSYNNCISLINTNRSKFQWEGLTNVTTRMYQIDPKVSEKRETNQTVIRDEFLTTIQSIMSSLSINNHTLIVLTKVTQMEPEIKPFNSKDWIDTLLDEDDIVNDDYVEIDDNSFGDLDLDYTHSQ
tara:strand:+ start:350 stop:841 length:492 start_codon:yes stop_codon:yes gene_type:complete